MAKEVWAEDEFADDAKAAHESQKVSPIGAPTMHCKVFHGQSNLAPVSTAQVSIYNVTFEPGCRNNWHIHHAKAAAGRL
jgi:quercetin dioxygenase-like cupin family protein